MTGPGPAGPEGSGHDANAPGLPRAANGLEATGAWSLRERRERVLACCASEPACVLCPLRPENAHRSLKELAMAGLRGNLDG